MTGNDDGVERALRVSQLDADELDQGLVAMLASKLTGSLTAFGVSESLHRILHRSNSDEEHAIPAWTGTPIRARAPASAQIRSLPARRVERGRFGDAWYAVARTTLLFRRWQTSYW
jgi:hypothetical protein